MIIGFSQRFGLSDVAKIDLLKIIHILIPKPNKLPKSVKLLEKSQIEKINVEEIAFCSDCHQVLKEEICCETNSNIYVIFNL